MSDDPYVDPNTGVFHNILGISDAGELAQVEADYTRVRIAQLVERPVPGSFDLVHLQAIHRHIFQDVYRCLPEHIESYAEQVFADLARRRYLRNLEGVEFAAGLAHGYADVNALHPFREGNGERIEADRNVWASIAGFRGDEAPLREMLDELIESIGQEIAQPSLRIGYGMVVRFRRYAMARRLDTRAGTGAVATIGGA